MKNLNFYLLTVSLILSAQGFSQQKEIADVLDKWHEAAAVADFDGYFSKMTSDAIFIGTDNSEKWNLTEFKAYSKPHFDKGKAWSFKALQRSVYLNSDASIAWFDELLDTQMQLCRGSGVMKKENGKWKIAHYVLSMTIPNDDSRAVIEIKSKADSIHKARIPKPITK